MKLVHMRIGIVLFILTLSVALHAQHVVTGRVSTSPGDEPAIGAIVQVKGTTTGTVTDLDGRFEIMVPDDASILEIHYTGYGSQEIAAGANTTIDVVMAEEISQLNEVIVTGYGSQKRSNITGSVSTINAEEIAEQPVLRVEQALQGRTAGVQVSQVSGSPGSPLTVRVRGAGTINMLRAYYRWEIITDLVRPYITTIRPSDGSMPTQYLIIATSAFQNEQYP